MKEMEECININESRIFYGMVNRDRKVFKPRVTMCSDSAGNVMTGNGKLCVAIPTVTADVNKSLSHTNGDMKQMNTHFSPSYVHKESKQ
jgi:hypothetical protein